MLLLFCERFALPRGRLALPRSALLRQALLNIDQVGDFGLGFLHSEQAGVVAVEFGEGVALGVAFAKVLVVVQAALVAGDAVVVAHVDGVGALLVGEQGLVHLLTVADADGLDVFFFPAEQLADGFHTSD